MSGKAAKVKCTEKLMEVLEQIIKSTRSEVRLVARAKIIWHAFYGKNNGNISNIVGLDSSWLNQIEIVFGIIQRRVIRHGNFRSLEALKDKLSQFIDYFNSTFAKPFNWTYTGRPTNAKLRPRPLTWKES